MIIGQGRCYYAQSSGRLNQNYTGFNTVDRAALLGPPTICRLVTDNAVGSSWARPLFASDYRAAPFLCVSSGLLSRLVSRVLETV